MMKIFQKEKDAFYPKTEPNKTVKKVTKYHTTRNMLKTSPRQAKGEILGIQSKIENVNYLLKIENKKQEDIHKDFESHLNKITQMKIKLENELNNSLKELNEKEAKIYNIQKEKIEIFKNELNKYQAAFDQLNEQKKKGDLIIKGFEEKEIQNLNKNDMLKEEILSFSNEIHLLDAEALVEVEKLKEIEKSYPKEFKFLKEDFLLQQQLTQTAAKIKANLVTLKNLTAEINKLENEDIQLKKDVDKINEEKKKKNIPYDIDSLNRIENHITKHFYGNLIIWKVLKDIMKDYFLEKHLDFSEKKLYYDKLLKLWENKRGDIIYEFEKKQKVFQTESNILTNRISELEKEGKKEEVESMKKSTRQINEDFSGIEIITQQIFELYSGFIAMLEEDKNNIEFSSIEEYFKSLAFQLSFRQSNIDSPSEISENLDQEGINKLLNVFLSEYNMKIIHDYNNDTQISLIEGKKNAIEKKKFEIENKISEKRKIKLELEKKNTELKESLNSLQELVYSRNKNLKFNFDHMAKAEFNEFLENNSKTLKNMEKIYAPKMVNKVKEIQQKGFYEKIVKSHLNKKDAISKYIEFTSFYRAKRDALNAEKENLLSLYKERLKNHQAIIQKKLIKQGEVNVIESSIKELKSTLDSCYKAKEKEVKKEKEALNKKYNVNYHIERIKDCSHKLEEIDGEQKKLTKEIQKYKEEMASTEKDLHLQDLELKHHLISLELGTKNQPGNITSPFKLNDITVPKHSKIEKDVKISLNKLSDADIELEKLKLHPTSASNSPEKRAKIQIFTKERLVYENCLPLIKGIALYKRYGNEIAKGKKQFDPHGKSTPENCGYGKKVFKMNKNGDIEIFSDCSKKSESVIKKEKLFKILISDQNKKLLRNRQIKMIKNCFLEKNECIIFSLVLSDSVVDLIAPDYFTYMSFESAINNLIRHKNQIKGILDVNSNVIEENQTISYV